MKGFLVTGLGGLVGYFIGMCMVWSDERKEAKRRAERSKQA